MNRRHLLILLYVFASISFRKKEQKINKEMKNDLINLPKSVYVTDPPLILSIVDVAEVVGIVAEIKQCKQYKWLFNK